MENRFYNYFSYYNWWKNIDKFILGIIITLFSIGLFFSLVSTSLIASDKLDTNSYFFFFKHLIFVTLGLIIVFIFSYLDQKFLFKASIFIFLISLLLLFLVPIVGIEVKGSKRWLELYFLPRLQPIEIVKPFFIIILSQIMTYKKISSYSFKFISSFFLMMMISSLLIVQPDLGQTLLIGIIWVIIIFISGNQIDIFNINFVNWYIVVNSSCILYSKV